MYSNQAQFTSEVKAAYSTIKGQNSWATRYFELEMHGVVCEADESSERCWRLYLASRNNALRTLLLGEVSMRSKLALVQNFGLTSAHGHEDDDEPWLSPWLGTKLKDRYQAGVPLDTAKVTVKSSTTLPATGGAKANKHLKSLQGPGSILSDRLWTPLMNDAWLLGGVHSRQTFHLVTEGLGEEKLVSTMNKLTERDRFERTRAKFGQAHRPPAVSIHELVRQAWLQWFKDNPTCLYETWGPRVLVRELIGLLSFGYEPDFTRHELGFSCVNDAKASGATVVAYSDELNKLRFHEGKNPDAKALVLKRLSAWLFGREDALP